MKRMNKFSGLAVSAVVLTAVVGCSPLAAAGGGLAAGAAAVLTGVGLGGVATFFGLPTDGSSGGDVVQTNNQTVTVDGQTFP